VLFLVYQFTLLNCSQICSDASTACDLTPQQSLASQEDCISPILSSSAQLKEPQWVGVVPLKHTNIIFKTFLQLLYIAYVMGSEIKSKSIAFIKIYFYKFSKISFSVWFKICGA